MKTLVLLILSSSACISVFSQTEPSQNLIQISERIIEAESEKTEQVQEDYSFFDEMENYLQAPVNLNKASAEELESFSLLQPEQVKALKIHTNRFGKIICIEELQVIPEFDEELIRVIKPFVTFGEEAKQQKITRRNLISESRNNLMLRFQHNPGSGTETSKYPGSNEKIYLRYRYQMADRLRIGINAEKDPGEEFFKGNNPYGFDFYSAHVIWKSNTAIRQITMGDFVIQSGQGLVMWSGMGAGKSSEAIAIQRNPTGIRPYTSVDENNFMRGACVSTSIHGWQSDLFYSSHKKDGSVSSSEAGNFFSAFQTSGYHRTASELKNEKSIRERIIGLNFRKSFGQFKVGGIISRTQFSKPFIKENRLYNQFEFQGKENLNYGLNISWLYKNMNTFGEIAMSKNGAMAILAGTMIHLHPKLTYALLIRKYDMEYQALQSNAFSENTKTMNELGVYSGIELKLPYNLRMMFFLDQFNFPWLRYQADAPGRGSDVSLLLKWKPRRHFETYIMLKSKTKEKNQADTSDKISFTENTTLYKVRWNLRSRLNESWTWGSRIEKSFFKKGNTGTRTGLMIFQDIFYHPMNSKFSVGIRYSIFDTDDYDTRIYAYENDVLFSYSIPAMQGNGSRMYFNLRYKVSRILDLWVRYSITHYEKEFTVTENVYEQKPLKKEIKLQMSLKF